MNSPHAEDLRLQQLSGWLSNQFKTDESLPIQAVAGDASFRRYFRVTHNLLTYIAVDAPPDKEDNSTFIEITRILNQHAIPAPQLHNFDLDKGFMLLEDFGDHWLLHRLNQTTADGLYGLALRTLADIQNIPADGLPLYDHALLQREMQLFPDWFLQKHLNIDPDTPLQWVFNGLIDNALQQPKVFVHRDYHSRNIMVRSDNRLGVIDYQDAVNGPITYDLVSLLRDCYIDWPIERVNHWVENYFNQHVSTSIHDNIHLEQFIRWFDLMGMQRHLKAIGIFSRLNYRDGKPTYLRDIPRTLQYVLTVAEKYSDYHDFATFLKERVKPALLS